MNALISLNDWMQAAIGATAECSTTTLGFELKVSDAQRLPPALTGCFVALVGDSGSLQIGFGSDPPGCQTLAKALFASEDDLPDGDVSDALGEIANIIAGGVKKTHVSGAATPRSWIAVRNAGPGSPDRTPTSARNRSRTRRSPGTPAGDQQ